jgi:hypothetical protein
MKVFGNGGKAGEVKPWLNKDQEELGVQHMAIAIDYILLHYILI